MGTKRPPPPKEAPAFPKNSVAHLPIRPPYPPMEARQVATIPDRAEWQYEPKWDGFRCLAFRDGNEVVLQSKSGRPLGRYFPEIVAALRRCRSRPSSSMASWSCPLKDALSFEELQMRLHPAASRVKQTGGGASRRALSFLICWSMRNGADLTARPLRERRAGAGKDCSRDLSAAPQPALSPGHAASRAGATLAQPRRWRSRRRHREASRPALRIGQCATAW